MKYLARQPILNRARELFAYELLFRNGIQNSCDGLDLELASTSVLDTSFLIGFEKITAGRPMFINCPRDFLLRDYISLFPPNSVVIEILENIKPDQEVVDACRRLKQAGYTIALDDFVDSPDWAPLVALADIIKVDFRLTDRKEQHAIVSRHAGKNIRMLAEKVETQEEYAAGMEMGYSLFQGYFFCRPEIMQHRSLPSFKLAYLELLRAATAPEFDVLELASKKPNELMTVPLIRGRFCEMMAPLAGMRDHSNDLFLMGLLSVMDAILDQPLDSILADLPVRREIKDALLARTGLYWRLLEIAIAHERADWEKTTMLVSETGMKEEQVSALYVSAVDWSTALRRSVVAPVHS